MGVGGHCHALAALPLERDPVPFVQEAVCGLGLVWTGMENLTSTGIPCLDHPVCTCLVCITVCVLCP